MAIDLDHLESLIGAELYSDSHDTLIAAIPELIQRVRDAERERDEFRRELKDRDNEYEEVRIRRLEAEDITKEARSECARLREALQSVRDYWNDGLAGDSCTLRLVESALALAPTEAKCTHCNDTGRMWMERKSTFYPCTRCDAPIKASKEPK